MPVSEREVLIMIRKIRRALSGVKQYFEEEDMNLMRSCAQSAYADTHLLYLLSERARREGVTRDS